MVRRVDKEWGYEEIIANDGFCFKRLHLKRGYRCSLHHHKIKDELFYIESGMVMLECYGKQYFMSPKTWHRVRPGVWHRFAGIEDSVILEASTHDEPSDSYRQEGQSSGKTPNWFMPSGRPDAA